MIFRTPLELEYIFSATAGTQLAQKIAKIHSSGLYQKQLSD